MRRLFIMSAIAVLLELIAMEAELMHLPSGTSVVLGVLGILVLAVALFEKAQLDEREQTVAFRSSHTAFLTVSVVLLGTLLYQTLDRRVEPWLLVVILALVVGKVAGRWRAQRRP